ncbi:MAG: response regulator [Candidatus Omnitrophica bacterium]|nr:response regulator [Candidatus Omnitrophota bacterium]
MTSSSPVIYVVDDDISVCRALKLLLKAHGFNVCMFTQAEDFLSFKHPKVPSCLLLDLRLPQMNGLQLQERMTAQGVFIPIIFISGHGDIPKSVKAIKAGAMDFLPKPFTQKKLLDAIAKAISKSNVQTKDQAEIAKINKRIKSLSARELEVFRLVAKGMLSKQIAYKRGVSLQTIKVHRGRVMHKMQAKTVTELIRFAQKAGITPPAC